MTDVPPDNGASGLEPAAPSDPPVIRRSNYAPPPPDAELLSFDDDALAEAMAAEVRPYTQPITLPKPAVARPPAEPESQVPQAPPVPVASPGEPSTPTWNSDAPALQDAPLPAPPASPASTESPSENPAPDELLRALGGASTLEAIERLEKELRLISSGEAPTLDLASTTAPDAPADAASAPPAAPPAATPEESDDEPEPALDHPAPGHFFPAAFEPISPHAAPADAAVGADPLAWLAPTGSPAGESATSELDNSEPAAPEPAPSEPAAPEPAVPAPGIASLPEVDESLIDPAAAAELNAAASDSLAVPAAEAPDGTTASPWWAATETDDGAWDLAAPVPEPAPVEPAAVEPPPVEPPPVEPPPVEPPAPQAPGPGLSGLETWAGPAALGPDDSGALFATPVPISTEPPVGPESPDWLDAPPPAYQPPELVEPPPFLDSPPVAAPSADQDPAEPITASAMSQLPKPLPTEKPKLEDRAELPPPPGYENIPIMSSDVAVTPLPVAPASFFPAGPPLISMPPPEATPTPQATPTADATETSALDHDEDDVIDAVDRVTGTGGIPISTPGTIEPLAPPTEPIATMRLGEGQPALVDEKVRQPSAFEVETAGPEPTALDLRAGRAARLFWLWFAANSSVLSLGLGAVLLGTGMSLRQAIVATLSGVAISFLPLGLGTLAGKWSGQPTMIVSRATFGHVGNILPALLAIATRVLWGGVLLWLLATAVAQVLVGAGLDAGLGTTIWQLVGLVAGFVIATVIAVFGYGFVAKLQLVLSIISALLIVGAAVLTYRHLDFATALLVPDGSWILVISGAALVFSVVGLAWVHSSSDLARYQRPASSGGSSMLWATFGATLPPFALIIWGAMLAASDPTLAQGLTTNPLAAIATLLPAWYPAPLLAAAAIGLLSGAVLTMYSGGFALQALGVRVRRSFGTFIAAILVLATSAALIFVVTDFSSLVRDLVITFAVPVAAWAGIFAAEMMIRTRRFHGPSLVAPGGLYPQVRWLNFLALLVVSVVGLGLVSSSIPGLRWEGFLYGVLGIGPRDLWAGSDAGVFVALLLGILVPLVGGVPAIRRQERTKLAN